jgi:osmoprotectant transport system substrate-binding protein
LFPPYYLAPVVRMDTVASNPKIVEVLERIGTLIDNPTMQELNRRVEVDKKEPRQVAAEFLKDKGIVR